MYEISEALLNPRGGNYGGHDTVDGFPGILLLNIMIIIIKILTQI